MKPDSEPRVERSSRSMVCWKEALLARAIVRGTSETTDDSNAAPRSRLLWRAAGILLLVAILGAGFSVGRQAVVRHEGLLCGEGLFTVRQPQDVEVTAVTDRSTVDEGAVLSQYRSDQRQAELAALELRCRNLEAEKKILECQAPATNPDIALRIAEAGRQKRSISNNLDATALERQHLARETLRDRLTREDAINALQTQIDKAQEELQQARNVVELMQDNYRRALALLPRNAISQSEYAEKLNEFKSRQIDVAKLERQLQNLGRQKSELERAMRDAAEVSAQHDQSLSTTTADLDARLKGATDDLKKLADEWTDDQVRASKHRSRLLAKLDMELEQAAAQRNAVAQGLQTLAPFAGRVVYRCPCPASALPGEPLLVLAPSGGLKFRARLPHWMKQPLERSGAVRAEVLDDRTGKEERQLLQHRVPATLAAWRDLPEEPGYGLAEFTCEPPAETVRLLAAGHPIAARLDWQPPFHAAPLFIPGVVLASLAGVGLAVRGRRI
jgi:hypothetical protein